MCKSRNLKAKSKYKLRSPYKNLKKQTERISGLRWEWMKHLIWYLSHKRWRKVYLILSKQLKSSIQSVSSLITKISGKRLLKGKQRLRKSSRLEIKMKDIDILKFTQYTTFLPIKIINQWLNDKSCTKDRKYSWKRTKLCLENQNMAYMAKLYQTSIETPLLLQVINNSHLRRQLSGGSRRKVTKRTLSITLVAN